MTSSACERTCGDRQGPVRPARCRRRRGRSRAAAGRARRGPRSARRRRSRRCRWVRRHAGSLRAPGDVAPHRAGAAVTGCPGRPARPVSEGQVASIASTSDSCSQVSPRTRPRASRGGSSGGRASTLVRGAASASSSVAQPQPLGEHQPHVGQATSPGRGLVVVEHDAVPSRRSVAAARSQRRARLRSRSPCSVSRRNSRPPRRRPGCASGSSRASAGSPAAAVVAPSPRSMPDEPGEGVDGAGSAAAASSASSIGATSSSSRGEQRRARSSSRRGRRPRDGCGGRRRATQPLPAGTSPRARTRASPRCRAPSPRGVPVETTARPVRVHVHHQLLGLVARVAEVGLEHVRDVGHQVHRVVPDDGHPRGVRPDVGAALDAALERLHRCRHGRPAAESDGSPSPGPAGRCSVTRGAAQSSALERRRPC